MGSRAKIQKIRFLCDTPKGLTLKSKDGAGWSIAAARSFPKNFVFNDKSEKVRLELAIEVEEDQGISRDAAVLDWTHLLGSSTDASTANLQLRVTDGAVEAVLLAPLSVGSELVALRQPLPRGSPDMKPQRTSTPLRRQTDGVADSGLGASDYSTAGGGECSSRLRESGNEEESGGGAVVAKKRKARTMLPCAMCGKEFDRPSLLKRHVRTHTGEKPHVCDFCKKAFSTSSSLNTHKRIHSGERPHVCNICGKRFTASSNLYYHRMTHNKVKPHKCTQCTKSFPTPGDLRSHMYVHNGSWPFKCEVCNRGFSKQTNLRNHALLHTGDRPHRCDLCDKRFALASNLRTHLKTHEDEPKCKCGNCGRLLLQASVPSLPPLCRKCATTNIPSGQRPTATRVNFHSVEDLASSSSALLTSPASHSSTQSSPTASDPTSALVYKVPLPMIPFSYGTSPLQPSPLQASPLLSTSAEPAAYQTLSPNLNLEAYALAFGVPHLPPVARFGTPGRSAFYALPHNHHLGHRWNGPL